MKLHKILSLTIIAGIISTSFSDTTSLAIKKTYNANLPKTAAHKKISNKKNVKAEINKCKQSLKAFNGSWNSMELKFKDIDPKILQSEFMVAIRGAAVKKKEKYIDKLSYFENFFDSPLKGVVISGNKIKYYDSPQIPSDRPTGKLLAVDTLKKAGTAKDKRFTRYEAVNRKPLYKYFYITKLHGEDLKHFHLLFGNKSFSELDGKLKKLVNLPTLIADDSTNEQIRLEICTPAINDYAGTWNTVYDIYSNPDNYMAVEQAAKSRETTPEKMISSFDAGYKSISINGDRVTFYSEADGKGTVTADGEYIFKGYKTISDKPGSRYIPYFEGKDGSTFKYMFFAPPHGYGEHAACFHVWYGNTFEEVSNMKKKPTFYDTSASPEDIKKIID